MSGHPKKESPSDRHNRLTHAFVTTVTREVMLDGGKESELMIILESLIMGVMLVNVRVFGLKPHAASGLAEAAMQRAIERFAEAAGQ
jgi:hypothetical protein